MVSLSTLSVKTFAVLYFPFNSSIFFAPFLFLILFFIVYKFNMLYFPYEKKTEASRFSHWLLILSNAQSMTESGFCMVLITLPNRKNESPRSPLLRISAGISPLFFRFPFRFAADGDAPLFSVLA